MRSHQTSTAKERNYSALLVAPGEEPVDVNAEVGDEEQPDGRGQRHQRQVDGSGVRPPPQLGQA